MSIWGAVAIWLVAIVVGGLVGIGIAEAMWRLVFGEWRWRE